MTTPSGDNNPSAMFFWPTPERPVVDRGEGIYLWDQDGKRYIDGSSGPQTANIGHGNVRVREAMMAQAEKVSYAFRSHFLNEPAELLAKEITEITPAGFDQVFFSSGGSEAVETCIKLARQYAVAIGQATRYKIISRLPSYHGTTLGALSLTGDPGGFSIFAPMMVNQPK
ncbi:MAG: aspartate aminotransferase family protein, partial [Alphaproteobacteria bacterium]|nr:aspartate aminotransferase family protein [Alphaproteobacteria bacterium]